LKKIYQLLNVLYVHRYMIRAMSIQEIKHRYAGTLGGFVWAVINPLATIFVFWFVFDFLFHSPPVNDVPFVLYFFCGFLPWMTFNESLMMSTRSIVVNTHLVKKTVFPTEILPIISIISCLIIHFVIVLIFTFILLCYGIMPSLWNLQIFYFLFALITFSIGLGWFLSAAHVFFRDVFEILMVILNIWFWFTPIVWNVTMLPKHLQLIVKINPLFYIVEGYRISFLTHKPIWDNIPMAFYFWPLCIMLFILGGIFFRQLKGEFPEVI
jgi:ABC-type polysaccharide/polyol phosphate export permease